MSTSDQYSLNWNNHTSHIKRAFDNLWSGNQFVDVTLSCEGKKISAHKMLLSACSNYFHDLFRDNPCQHPIVILRDVKFDNLVNILKFIYSGEVSVAMDSFDEFLRTAKLLQISGLTDEDTKQNVSDTNSENIKSTSNEILDNLPLPSLKSITNEELRESKESVRKRPFEINNTENVSEKRKKDNEVHVTVEIKQETVVEDNVVEIKDPLDIEEEPNESTDIEPATSQKCVDVQDFLNDKQSPKNSFLSVEKEDKFCPSTSMQCNINSVRVLPTLYPPLVITHVPTQIPSTQKKQYPTRKCRYCPGRKETRWQCAPCGNVPLHRENCFEIYHTKLLYN